MQARVTLHPSAHPARLTLALVGWVALCFGLHRPGLAFGEIVLLWLAIGATLVAFSRVSQAAAWLLAPYLARVTLAAALNFARWRLN